MISSRKQLFKFTRYHDGINTGGNSGNPVSLFGAWLFCKTHAAKWTTIFSGRLESRGANYMERDRDRGRKKRKESVRWASFRALSRDRSRPFGLKSVKQKPTVPLRNAAFATSLSIEVRIDSLAAGTAISMGKHSGWSRHSLRRMSRDSAKYKNEQIEKEMRRCCKITLSKREVHWDRIATGGNCYAAICIACLVACLVRKKYAPRRAASGLIPFYRRPSKNMQIDLLLPSYFLGASK